jgi:WD40 repeat protein
MSSRLTAFLFLMLASPAIAQTSGELPMPDGALVRFGSPRFIQTEALSAIAISHDGKTLATTTGHHGIQFWDMGSRVATRYIKSNVLWISRIAVSPNRKQLAYLYYGEAPKIAVLETDTGATLWQADGGGFVDYLPDGKLLTVNAHHQPALLDPETGKEIRAFGIAKEGVHATQLAVSRDGKTAATLHQVVDPSAAGNVRFHASVWDTATGKERLKLTDNLRDSSSLSLSPDGKILVVGNIGLVFIDVESGQVLRRVSNDNSSWYAGGDFSHDGRKLAVFEVHNRVAADKMPKTVLHLFDATTGESVGQSEVYWPFLFWLKFLPDDSSLLCACQGCGASIWNASPLELSGKKEGHLGTVNQLRFSADSKSLISGDVLSEIRWWDVAGRKHTRAMKLTGSASVDVSKDGRSFAVIQADQRLVLLDESRKPHFQMDLPAKLARFSPDGKHLAWADMQGVIHLADAASGKEVRRLDRGLSKPRALVFSSDGKRMLSTLHSYTPSLEMLGANLVPDNSRPQCIYVWDVDSGKVLRKIEPALDGVEMSPDGLSLAAHDGAGGVVVTDVATNKTVHHIATKGKGVRKIAFSADGRSLATSDDDCMVHWWSIAKGQERCCFLGHGGAVESLAFSPNGTMLASGSADTSVVVWKLYAPMPGPRPINELWTDFLGNSRHSYKAMRGLLARPDETLALVKKSLRPVPGVPAEQIKDRIADLDSSTYAIRTAAMRELESWQEQAQPHLIATLEQNPPLEVRRRIEILLTKYESARLQLSAEEIQTMDTLELLEHLGTPQAREYLEVLAAGGADARLTLAAKAAVKRVDGNPSGQRGSCEGNPARRSAGISAWLALNSGFRHSIASTPFPVKSQNCDFHLDG